MTTVEVSSNTNEKKRSLEHDDGQQLQNVAAALFAVPQPAAKKAKAGVGKFPIPYEGKLPTLQAGAYTTAELREKFEKFGFVVIENVLTAAECDKRRDELFDAYTSLYNALSADKAPLGLDPRQPSTLDNGTAPPYKGSGMVAVDGCAGLRTLNELRLDPRVGEVFAKYYNVGVDELAKSSDRFGMMMPNKARTELEPHIDANILHAERTHAEDVIQGFVVLQASSQPDQGLVIYPNHADDINKWNDENRGEARDIDYYSIADAQREKLGRGRVINAPRGSQVIWRSVVPHGNTSGAGVKTTVGRVVAYISMYPYQRMSDDAKATLEQAFLNHTTLGHNLLRPTPQRVGANRWGPKLQWRFAEEHLQRYATSADLPPGLRPPQAN